jgi:hypothetical protein
MSWLTSGGAWGLSSQRAGGLLAAVAVEDGSGALVTITLFEDRASLMAAQPLAEKWTTEHHGRLSTRGPP